MKKTVAKDPANSRVPPPRSRSDLRLEESRVAELLDIASQVFLENGFAGASMNEIARLSNSSKTTFYSRFPTKEKLFIAVMERRMETVLGEVTAPLPAESPIDVALKEYGTRFLRFALSDEQITLLRIISMESVRFPELGERFYELGPKRGQTFLAGYFQEQIKLGHLVRDDPWTMAEHLISLLSGGLVRWRILGLQTGTRTKDKQQEHIAGVLRVFLRAYGTPTLMKGHQVTRSRK
ncbi:TetR/AcrR family transcriptional regulator [Tunturiibacter gelidoferens]|uniref:AcrR family transcriptional regulator n=2 Tax=Tunturiibacter TaxID=3154218 RepID=A0A7Y9T2M4_9BACT|nr:TetR/AcrR family transcriptional regulator [Edaphobacter lichenicola]MBB5339428.1 AcrR family transcriptional regulator [Edaphobacter lichenicola]NYF51312.1 AcrR family transcriptional regulator [Edaphobacter lichenicola]